VYIEQKSRLADIILPAAPFVVSLNDYDNVGKADGSGIIQGYPVICVSVSLCVSKLYQ